jgi:hypothetical protein
MDSDILAIIVITVLIFAGVGASFYWWQRREGVSIQDLSASGELHFLGSNLEGERAVPLGVELRVKASLRVRKTRGRKPITIQAVEITLDPGTCSRLTDYLEIPLPTRLGVRLDPPEVIQFPDDVTTLLEVTSRYPMNDRITELYRERMNPRQPFQRNLQLSPQMLFERRRHATEEVEKVEEELKKLVATLGSGLVGGWQSSDGKWSYSESVITRTMMPR